jgi:AcrR family transcriptional regulator
MRAIASAIEYTPAALYKYFPDKEGLIRALCEEDFKLLSDNFTPLRVIHDEIERLRLLGRAYVTFAIHHPHHYRLLFMTIVPLALDEKTTSQGDTSHLDGYSFLLWAVEEAIRAEKIARPLKDSKLVAQTLWATVHGIASLEITMKDDPCIEWEPLQNRVEMMLEAILAGLQK